MGRDLEMRRGRGEEGEDEGGGRGPEGLEFLKALRILFADLPLLSKERESFSWRDVDEEEGKWGDRGGEEEMATSEGEEDEVEGTLSFPFSPPILPPSISFCSLNSSTPSLPLHLNSVTSLLH